MFACEHVEKCLDISGLSIAYHKQYLDIHMQPHAHTQMGQ